MSQMSLEAPPTPSLHQERLTPAQVVGRPLGKFERSVSLVGWGYNEEELVAEFVERAHAMMSQYVEDFEIILVNDGSTDRTGEILAQAAERYPELRVITFSQNRGIGEAANEAISAATKDYLFWQTMDWSYDLTDLRYFLEMTKHYDVVAGVRRSPISSGSTWAFLRRASSHIQRRSDNLMKAIVSVSNYLVVRVLFNFPMSDYQNITFYPTRLIQSIKMESRSSFGNPEYLMKSCWKGASILEVPISFIPRIKGEAKGTRVGSILKSVSDILKLWFRWTFVQKLPFQGSKGTIRRLVPSEWNQETRRQNASAL